MTLTKHRKRHLLLGASVALGFFTGLFAKQLGGMPAQLPVAALVGFGGMLLDSALGAAAQGRFRCPRCAETSEWPRHRCGAVTVHEGGLPWLDNDGVNLASAAAAALAAGAAWRWLYP